MKLYFIRMIRWKMNEKESRFYELSPHLIHNNLFLLKYNWNISLKKSCFRPFRKKNEIVIYCCDSNRSWIENMHLSGMQSIGRDQKPVSEILSRVTRIKWLPFLLNISIEYLNLTRSAWAYENTSNHGAKAGRLIKTNHTRSHRPRVSEWNIRNTLEKRQTLDSGHPR